VSGTEPPDPEIAPEGADAATRRERAFELAKAGDAHGAKIEIGAWLRVAPGDGVAHRLHATALMHTGDIANAIVAFQNLVRCGCDDAPTHLQLGMALKFRGRCADASRHFRRACTLDPSDANARWAEAVASLPMVPATNAALDASIAAFADRVAALERWWDENPQAAADGVVAEPNPFQIAYFERDVRDVLARYGALCVRLMARWDAGRVRHAPAIVADGRRRVGIVSRYFYRHSVWTAIVKGMLLGLDPRRFRIDLFHIGDRRDDETGFARARAAAYVSGLAETGAAVDAIRAATPEILIYPEIGMDPLSTRLAALRLAPLQIVSWGHPVTSGLPTVDRFLSAAAFEPPDGAAHYTERLVALPGLGAQVERETTAQNAVDLVGIGIDPKRPYFVCPGVPWKYTPDFDAALCAIIGRVPDSQFVFFRPIVQVAAAESLRARLAAAFAKAGIAPAGRLVFVPWLERGEFAGLLAGAVACLDGIGFSGFNTALQSLQAGTPVVTLAGRFMRGRLAAGLQAHVGLPEFSAADVPGYVERAVACAGPGFDRARQNARIRLAAERAFDDDAPMRALAAALSAA
jgi:predicted O-linked N-acetylglucosamine transferase (SPINDLY family)